MRRLVFPSPVEKATVGLDVFMPSKCVVHTWDFSFSFSILQAPNLPLRSFARKIEVNKGLSLFAGDDERAGRWTGRTLCNSSFALKGGGGGGRTKSVSSSVVGIFLSLDNK